MREPSPGAPSPKGSINSLTNGSVTKNIGFQQQNNKEHLPWNSSAVSLPGNCNTNLANESHPPLERSSSNAAALTSLCVDLSPSDSHFFEVLYIGKVRISQRKVPESLIDDALHKFAQHELEKAKSQRRHSLMSSSGTSITDKSTETLNDDKKFDSIENVKKLNLSLTSTTPLEPDKNYAWKSTENLTQTTNESLERNEIDKEFDKFTRERVEGECIIRKPSQVPLEPFVLVLNVPNKNLGTVKEDEEKNEEIQSVISENASSVTQFCQIQSVNSTAINKFKDKNSTYVSNDHAEQEDSTSKDALMPGSVIDRSVNNNETSNKTVKIQTLHNSGTVEDYNINESPHKPKTIPTEGTEVDNKTSPMPENKHFLRDRSASIGTLNHKTPIAHLIGEQNRTMLFQIGRSELRLISPDRKQILLHRAFKDVASCVLGRVNMDHFGFVCRETTEAYACYVFKCESDSVATEVVNAIKQAFLAHAEFLKKSREKSPNMTCEHCPMLWYHRLCHDVEGMSEKKTHAFILRRIEQLPEEEQELIITKYQGGTNHMFEVCEHNAFLMMLLRAHCEAKQQRHVHDTAENRTEFLNQYLGGSTIFMKAKRSLSSGFDHLLKRRASRDGDSLVGVHSKKEPVTVSLPAADSISESTSDHLSPDLNRSKSMSPAIMANESPLSKTINATVPAAEQIPETKDDSSTSPMMDIFLKVSDNRPTEAVADNESDATWRQAIYEKVVQPPDGQRDGDLTPNNLLGMKPVYQGKRSKNQLRNLWKMAIDQTILLVRMEKENARLKEGEESSAVRRIKLEYSDLGMCDAGVTLMWDTLLSREKSQPMAKVDRHMLTQAVMQGVPRMTRGGVWYFLAEQFCLRTAPPDVKNFPKYHTPYYTLISGLTKHQHAILIDLGRTFPQHSYFSSSLGPGQLALYNILKGYSLLDPDVGYCQGLSFVAGVLLLHMEEADAFVLLRHLMFRRGLRKQYLPDMSALQVQMYQLSRLLRDHEPELHAKLEQLDISPALYAAPWMLTLFTSQFPLGFVVRVFDLIFLESLDVVFSVSLALLTAHKDGLMLCESCEEAAEYLKHKLPDIDKVIYDKVMKKVHTLDISRQLADYAVEYAVLREEMPRLATLTDENRRLISETTRMSDELDSAMEAINKYQNSQTRLESQNRSLEQQLTLLSRYISAHRQDVPIEIKKIIQNYSKKISFSSKISSFSSKFTSSEDIENDPRKNLKTGMSAPNLFAKISKEDVTNAVNREKNKISPEKDRKQFMMKKSQSVHSGLIANNLKHYPLQVLEEQPEKHKRSDSLRTDSLITESLRELGRKNTGYFANTHELIRQERLFEQQQKHVFDENLKKLDEKINPKSFEDDINTFQSRKSLSLNLKSNTKEQESKLNDSGFVTPLSPNDNERKDDSISIVSHPLSDCDVDIKFDGQSTKLKQIRPIRHVNPNILESKP